MLPDRGVGRRKHWGLTPLFALGEGGRAPRRRSRRARSGRSRPPGSGPGRRRCPPPRGSSSPNACDERPRLHSGSSRWASKPAETIRRPGSKSRSAGSASCSNASRNPARTARGERNVHRRALARASAALGAAPGPRIERVLVERDVEHIRVVPEDRLGAVSVVRVPVEHRHPLDAARPAHGPPRRRRGSRGRSPWRGPPRHGGPAAGPGRTPPRRRRPARRRPPPWRRPRRRPRRRSSARSRPCRGRSPLRPRSRELADAGQELARVHALEILRPPPGRAPRRAHAPPERRASPRPSGRAAPGADPDRAAGRGRTRNR